LDSWSGQNEKTFQTVLKSSRFFNIKTISTGTTGMIQPLDVFFFRPWKNFIKHFSDIVVLYNYEINFHLRNNIIKLQSLIYNQFSSHFSNLLKYTWYKSSYLPEKPPAFESPVDFCLKDFAPVCDLCNNTAIMKCGWCKKSLCMKQFFMDYHYCQSYCQ